MLSFIISATFLGAALPPAKTAKDEFVFINRAEVETIDPQMASGVPDATIITQLFEGLMAQKADWVTLIPGMAESYQQSKDLKTFIFKLRPNLKWSDGSPLTAKDFEYSWLRVMRPATLAVYSYWLTDNITGAKEYAKNPTDENAKKVGVKALDDHTFQVKLAHPVPYFLHLTAEAVTFPVKKDVVEKFGDQWTRPEHIVSNGPYRLTLWGIQDRMVMEKNSNYHDAKNMKINRVVARPIEDRQLGMNLYKQGEVDWSGQNGVPNSLVPNLKKQSDFRIFPGFVSYVYWVNTLRPPLNDKRVRQALSLAIDRKELVDKVTRGGETPAGFFVPQHTGKYISPSVLVTDNYQADLKKARALLAEAGFPDGKGMRPLELQYNTDENHKKVAIAIQEMWHKQLGVPIRPYNQEWKVYLKEQRAHNFDISRGGWQGDYPDPSTYLELLTSTSDNNYTGWKNKTYDDLFFKASAMPEGKKRNELLAKAEGMMLEEAPILPIFIYTNFGYLRPEIVGFEPNLIDRPFIRFMSKNLGESMVGGATTP